MTYRAPYTLADRFENAFDRAVSGKDVDRDAFRAWFIADKRRYESVFYGYGDRSQRAALRVSLEDYLRSLKPPVVREVPSVLAPFPIPGYLPDGTAPSPFDLES